MKPLLVQSMFWGALIMCLTGSAAAVSSAGVAIRLSIVKRKPATVPVHAYLQIMEMETIWKCR